MPIFTSTLRQINYDNPTEAMKQMANHIRQIQEELEYALMNLDSTNVSELDFSQTSVSMGDIHIDCGELD